MLPHVDDTSIGTETEEEHSKSLHEILTVPYENVVRLKLSIGIGGP